MQFTPNHHHHLMMMILMWSYDIIVTLNIGHCYCPYFSTAPYYHLLKCLNTTGWVANSVDLGQMLHPAASDLSLHCLLRPDCPTIKGWYGTWLLKWIKKKYICIFHSRRKAYLEPWSIPFLKWLLNFIGWPDTGTLFRYIFIVLCAYQLHSCGLLLA